MKKPQHNSLLTVTAIFVAFIIGFFLGRSYNHSDIQLTTAVVAQTTEVSREAAPITADTSTSTVQTEPAATHPPTEVPTLVNINTATLEELDSLPGIGPVIAQRILDYRDTHGPFTSAAQLTNVSGIGAAKLAAIIDLITVE